MTHSKTQLLLNSSLHFSKHRSTLRKPLLKTLTPLKRARWNFELRHRMKPKSKENESTTRKAKLHIVDSRLDEPEHTAIMYNRNRQATDSYVDMTNGFEPSVDYSPGADAVNLLYKDFDEPYSQHRSKVLFNKSYPYYGLYRPFIAPSATIIGDVAIGEESSIWYDAVLRADLNKISIGSWTNIQDGAIITTDDRPTKTGRPSKVFVGNQVTVGHNAKLHSCRIDDQCIVGMNSIVLEGARMHTNSILAANSVLLPGQVTGSYEIWAGNPARKVRTFSLSELQQFEEMAIQYRKLANVHDTEFAGVDPDVNHRAEADHVKDQLAQHMPDTPQAPMHWNVWDMLHNFKKRFTFEYYTWSYMYDPEENKKLPGQRGK